MNRIYTTIFSSELGSAPAQQPGRNSGCCYRSQTVNSFALSSLQSIRLYTREEVAGIQDNAVLKNLSIQYISLQYVVERLRQALILNMIN